MSDHSKQNSTSQTGASDKTPDKRKARLSDALRGNLRRRKAQSKSRSDSDLGSKGPGLLAAIKEDKAERTE
ncbi:MAG: hypothetical protein OIF56_15150 [Cohaesibacter sp.]|nr:hypothetical protein [Cohaesibacter sp.]MCV6603365.1 hypothetical protein [Cohaesibacter sp.]